MKRESNRSAGQESDFVHGKDFAAAFRRGGSDREELLSRIEALTDTSLRDQGLYTFAQMQFAESKDTEAALGIAAQMKNLDEQTRFRVHVALKLVESGDSAGARKIVKEISSDPQGYLRSYEQDVDKMTRRRKIQDQIAQYEKLYGKFLV